MKRKFLSKGNKVLALAIAAAMTFPMLPASTVKAAETSTKLYTDEAALPAGWTVGTGAAQGVNTDKKGNATNKLALVGTTKADYKLASPASTGHVKLEYEAYNEGVANAMVIYDSNGAPLINVGGAKSGNINIMPGYPEGAASGADYATAGTVFEWVGASKEAWRKVSIDIDLDKSNKDKVLSFTLNFYEPDGDYKGANTKWKLFSVVSTDDASQTRDGKFSQAAYTNPRGNTKGSNIVPAGAHANGAATPGITSFNVAGIQLYSTGDGLYYDNMVLTVGTAEASAPAASTPAPSKPATPSVSSGNEGFSVSGGNEYVIQKGDTLYSIAKKLLGSGSKWKDLYNLNSATIKDANQIFAGQVLKVK